MPGLHLLPDGGVARRDTQYDGELLWEVAALGRGWMRERLLCRGGEEMREQIREGSEAGMYGAYL